MSRPIFRILLAAALAVGASMPLAQTDQPNDEQQDFQSAAREPSGDRTEQKPINPSGDSTDDGMEQMHRKGEMSEQGQPATEADSASKHDSER